jgi:hypothetical protein
MKKILCSFGFALILIGVTTFAANANGGPYHCNGVSYTCSTSSDWEQQQASFIANCACGSMVAFLDVCCVGCEENQYEIIMGENPCPE